MPLAKHTKKWVRIGKAYYSKEMAAKILAESHIILQNI